VGFLEATKKCCKLLRAEKAARVKAKKVGSDAMGLFERSGP
jgi:hypothetical protein